MYFTYQQAYAPHTVREDGPEIVDWPRMHVKLRGLIIGDFSCTQLQPWVHAVGWILTYPIAIHFFLHLNSFASHLLACSVMLCYLQQLDQ
jgi:hypothetical protein